MRVKERLIEREEYLFNLCKAIGEVSSYDTIYNREVVKVSEFYLKFNEYLVNGYLEDAITNGRRACEAICVDLYNSNGLKQPYKEDLNSSIKNLFKYGIIDRRVLDRFNSTRLMGNFGTHYQKNELNEVTYDDAEWAFEGLKFIVKWYYEKFNINLDDIEWRKARKINNIDGYKSYINGQWNNKYKYEALLEIKNLEDINNRENEDNNLWKKACCENTIQTYKAYLISGNKYKEEAMVRIKSLEEVKRKERIDKLKDELLIIKAKKEDEEVWKSVLNKDTLEDYYNYINGRTIKKYKKEAIIRIKEIKFKKIEEEYKRCIKINTLDQWRIFIKDYPESKYLKEAKEIYDKLLRCEVERVELERAKRLIDNGDITSIKKLAEKYYYGVKVKENRKQAYVLYKLAADKGDLESIIIMSHIYTYGITVDKNFKMAFEYYKKGAKLGDTNCLVDMAFLLRRGIDIKENKELAKELFEIAAKNGNKAAKSYLKRMYNIII